MTDGVVLGVDESALGSEMILQRLQQDSISQSGLHSQQISQSLERERMRCRMDAVFNIIVHFSHSVPLNQRVHNFKMTGTNSQVKPPRN